MNTDGLVFQARVVSRVYKITRVAPEIRERKKREEILRAALRVDFFFVAGERPLRGVLSGSRRRREAPSFTRGTRKKPGRAVARRC